MKQFASLFVYQSVWSNPVLPSSGKHCPKSHDRTTLNFITYNISLASVVCLSLCCAVSCCLFVYLIHRQRKLLFQLPGQRPFGHYHPVFLTSSMGVATRVIQTPDWQVLYNFPTRIDNVKTSHHLGDRMVNQRENRVY